MKLHYDEGTLFAVPLKCGGYGVGLITRMTRRGRVLLCYFFQPAVSTIPDVSELSDLRPEDAVKAIRIGDLNLYGKEWPIIGKLPSWERTKWPVPLFVRRSELSEKAWLVYYSDEDPGQVEREESVPFPTTEHETAGLYGAGAVELLLTRLLCASEQMGGQISK